MTITLSPEMQAALEQRARQQGTTPETLVVAALQEKLALTAPALSVQAQDDWERLVLGLGTECGVSLSHQALSSEGLYD